MDNNIDSIDREVYLLGEKFKDFVRNEYKYSWFVLSDTTLREAIDRFKKERHL